MGCGAHELAGVPFRLFTNKKVCAPNKGGEHRLYYFIKLSKTTFREVFEGCGKLFPKSFPRKPTKTFLPNQFFYDFGSHQEAGDGGDEGEGAWGRAFDLGILDSGCIGRCLNGGFIGEDDGEVCDATRFELAAHDASEGASGGFCEVGDLEARGIELISGTHRGDDGGVCLIGAHDELEL